MISSESNTGTGNQVALRSSRSIIWCNGSIPGATTAQARVMGGQIWP